MDELWFLNFFHALKLFNINFKINALSLLVCLFVFRKVKIALKEVLPKKKKKGKANCRHFLKLRAFNSSARCYLINFGFSQQRISSQSLVIQSPLWKKRWILWAEREILSPLGTTPWGLGGKLDWSSCSQNTPWIIEMESPRKWLKYLSPGPVPDNEFTFLKVAGNLHFKRVTRWNSCAQEVRTELAWRLRDYMRWVWSHADLGLNRSSSI